MYAWIVLLHIVGAFIFVMAHGASVVVALRLRGVRDRGQQAALLEVSGISIGAMYIGLALLLIGGIWAGFAGEHWGRIWIWAALGVLVVVIAVMYSVATPFYGRMRAAAGIEGGATPDRFKPPATEADLAALATSQRPFWLAAVGGVGLLVILWLMVVKPF